MLKHFIHYFKPHKKLFFLDMVCALIVAVCDLFYPLITKDMINDYIPNGKLRLLLVWSGTLLVIYLVKAALNYIITYYGHMMGVRLQADMRHDIFKKMQALPFSFFDENKTGTLMSRIVNDLMEISELAHHGPEDLFISFILLVGSFCFMCSINLPLTLIIFAVLPVIVVFAVLMRKRMGRAFTRTREEIAEVNASIENSISGIRVSRAYTSADHEVQKFDHYNERFKIARSRAYKVMAEFGSCMTLFTDLLYLVVLLAGGLFFFNGQIDVGEFAAFLLFINMFLNPIKRLVGFFEQFQDGMSGFKRFEKLMSEQTEAESPNALSLPRMKGVIDFQDVSFHYDSRSGIGAPEDESLILENLNLHIDAGKTVALVGPSGGGKTTLCHLIPRFYEISAGSIKIDGHDITQLTRLSLRQNIGMVAQDVFLFTGTIRENIAYGNLDATDDEIVEAAKKANIHDFILSLEEGYDTYIGERGVKLSGGQRQRISIARVFLKNPPILILDEATSALDNTTERIIQKSLEELSVGRTAIIVAHRLSTIKNADEILVLEDGGIKERGTHEELLEKSGLYAELYHSQFKE